MDTDDDKVNFDDILNDGQSDGAATASAHRWVGSPQGLVVLCTMYAIVKVQEERVEARVPGAKRVPKASLKVPRILERFTPKWYLHVGWTEEDFKQRQRDIERTAATKSGNLWGYEAESPTKYPYYEEIERRVRASESIDPDEIVNGSDPKSKRGRKPFKSIK